MTRNDKRVTAKPPPDAWSIWARRAIFVCLGLVFLQASAWQIAGLLVKLGRADFAMFGTDSSMVIESMPAFTMGFVAGVFKALILTVLVLLALGRKRARTVLLVAVGLHLMIWVRVAFNPYVPAWPGLVIFTLEMIALVLLSMLSNRRQLR
jgi:hypothetical protein